MDTLLRILGIQLVARAAAGLPGGWARLATAVVLVVVNLLPVWAVGMLGTAFHPLRRSWLDRVMGSRAPYLVHVERRSDRNRSEWV